MSKVTAVPPRLTGLILCLWVLLAASPASAALTGARSDRHNDLNNVDGQFGTVHFRGDVLVSPCILASQSQEQLVDMKTASAGEFHRIGDRSRKVTFVLKLQDCLAGARQVYEDFPGHTLGGDAHLLTSQERVVSLFFSGESNAANPNLLQLEGNLHGLGLRLFDAQGNPLSLNQAQPPYLLSPGNNSLTFMAALESTGSRVSSGSYLGTLHLRVEYL